jgi:hypothetical protein
MPSCSTRVEPTHLLAEEWVEPLDDIPSTSEAPQAGLGAEACAPVSATTTKAATAPAPAPALPTVPVPVTIDLT